MRLLGIVLCLGITCSAAQRPEEVQDRWKGRCSMLGETMTAFELPAISAILDLQVDIYLTEGEASLPEYPPPQPRAYLRFDAVPSTSQYDAEGRLEDLQWHWEQHRPKKAQRMYVGINGGLTEALQLQCAYSLRQWKVTVEIRYRYCAAGWELDVTSQDCILKVITAVPGANYTTEGEYIAGRLDVPQYTSIIHFQQISVYPDPVALISPWNYAEIASNGTIILNPETYIIENGALSVPNPRAGTWFFTLKTTHNASFAFVLAMQNQINRVEELAVSQEGAVPLTIATIPIKYTHKADNQANFHTLFALTPKSIYAKYTLKLTFPSAVEGTLLASLYRGSTASPHYYTVNSSISALFPTQTHPNSTISLLLHLNYLYPDMNILSLQLHVEGELDTIGLGVASSPCGVENCNGDPCNRLSGPVPVSSCDCKGPRAGENCDKQALTSGEFALWVLLLTTSNLAMLPAIYLSFWLYGKYGEGCVFLSTMVTSFMYHACDSQYFCFGFQSTGLRHTDFYLSYLSIAVSILYLARLKTDLKLGCTMLYVVLLLYAMTQTHFNSLIAEVGIPVSAGLIPLGVYIGVIWRFSGRLEGKTWSWKVLWRFLFHSGNFRWKYGIFAICSFATALIANLFLQSNYSYWLVNSTQTHSLWHICIMLTPAFVLSVYPPQPPDFQVSWESEGCQPLL